MIKIDTIKELIEVFEGSSLSKLSVSDENETIEMERVLTQPTMVNTVISTPVETESFVSNESIKSPLVGLFFTHYDTQDEPFFKVGDTIHKGDVICLIEAMKTINEIKSDKEGIIKEIKVKHKDSVEFDQELFILEPLK